MIIGNASRAALLFVSVFLTACQSAYYSAWETFGVEKRDILVDRVESAKDAQEDAQEQFSSALEELSALIAFDGGELEKVYKGLKSEYESSVSSAERVSARIDKVQDVAEALFDEWQTELSLYKSENLRRDSQRKLKETQRQYRQLIIAMRASESKMQPILDAMQDNMLYLKHNLNANAIGALKGELTSIQRDVTLLIKEMNASIEASDAFIEKMKS